MKKNVTEEKAPQDDLLSEFEKYLKKKNQSDNTVTAYLVAIRYYYALYQELTLVNLQAYRSFLIKNYRPATINQRIHALNSYLTFLETDHRNE